MKNPWLNIKHNDYDNHMTEVGQAQVLSGLVKYCADKYLPEHFALLGCATGNGLEHINPDITNKVYAIDINQDFLHLTKEKFGEQINGLEIVKADIQNEELFIKNIDLFFVGLVLEYVDPTVALKKIIKTLNHNGILFIVLQKSNQISFVSKTKYKSLETLSTISKEVEEAEVDKYLKINNMELIRKEEIKLTESKSFITLEYKKMA